MGRTPALTTISNHFAKSLDSAEDLYLAVKPFADGSWHAINGWEVLYPGQAQRVTSLAFMQMVLGWEQLVESVFVRYVAGASSPSGYAPILRLSPAKSLAHAYQLASGNPNYNTDKDFMTWVGWESVEALAKVFFEAGRPFSNITPLERARLAECITIRNRIAHNSGKCKAAFKKVARFHLNLGTNGKLKQGYSAAQLLLTNSGRHFGPHATAKPIFEQYLDILRSCGQRICPS